MERAVRLLLFHRAAFQRFSVSVFDLRPPSSLAREMEPAPWSVRRDYSTGVAYFNGLSSGGLVVSGLPPRGPVVRGLGVCPSCPP